MQNEIQVGRYSALLHKLLDMKEGAPSPTLATDIFPVMVLETDRPEWKFLAGERLCFMRWYDNATAGEYSVIGIRNPAGSGVLLVTESILVAPNAAGDWSMGIRGNTTVDATNPGRTRDTRTAAQTTTGQIIELTQVGVPAYPMYQGSILANDPWLFEVPVVLTPGWELVIWPGAQNVSMECSFAWRERPLESSETR